VGEFLDRVIRLSAGIQEKHGKKLIDFEKGLKEDEGIKALRQDVLKFGIQFDMPMIGN